MIARNFALFCLVLGSLSLTRLETAEASKGANTPGTYRDWNGDIDEVTMHFEFRKAKLWRYGDSNPRPRHCERRALPTELYPREETKIITGREIFINDSRLGETVGFLG